MLSTILCVCDLPDQSEHVLDRSLPLSQLAGRFGYALARSAISAILAAQEHDL